MKKKIANPTPADATWFDHQQLLFWLSACLKDAAVYLNSSREATESFERIFSSSVESLQKYKDEYNECSAKQALDAYHFVIVTGNLLRLLKRAQYLFPSIQPPYSRAKHLLSEGKELRDMLEHAHGNDGYLAGGGHHRDKFVRDDAPKPGFSADATSTFIDKSGHWLGGRLCVELVVNEVSKIYEIAKTIPAPEGEI